MIEFPNQDLIGKNSVIDDLNRLSDWIEISCLIDESGEASTENVAEILHSSGLLTSYADEIEYGADEPEKSVQEIALDRASEILSNILDRSRLIGENYPFLLENGLVIRRQDWRQFLCYTSLLLADIGRFYRHYSQGSGVRFGYLFEKVVEACMASITNGTTVRFGWPRDVHLAWPTDITGRIELLAERFEVEPGVAARTLPWDKDIGLDIATRWRKGDELPGLLVILVQCATGNNWKGKTGQPSLSTWNQLITWNSRLVRGVAFPWRIDLTSRELARLCDEFEAMIFDRFRLLSGSAPDTYLDPEVVPKLEEWCVNRIEHLISPA